MGVATLQVGDDAEGLHVVIKAAVRLHRPLQLVFSRMAERGVTEVVGESHRLR
jgi:hypothetical protein